MLERLVRVEDALEMAGVRRDVARGRVREVRRRLELALWP